MHTVGTQMLEWMNKWIIWRDWMNRISRDSDLRKFFVHLTFIFTHISLIYLNSYNTKTNCKHPTLILWSSSTSWAVKGIRPASEKKPKQLRDSIITGDPITVSDRSYLMTVEAFLTDTSRGCPALSLHLGYHWSINMLSYIVGWTLNNLLCFLPLLLTAKYCAASWQTL